MRPTRRALALALALSLTLSLAGAAREKETWRYAGVSRVVAIGDVHGAFDELTSVLRGVGLIDEQHAWSGGSTHLVMLGDLVDRGPRSIDVLELLIALQPQAKKAGGRVHVVLGNHEAMLLTRDLRYVDEADYRRFSDDERAADRQAAWRRAQGTSVLSREETAPRRAHFDALYPPGFFGHLRAFAAEGRYGSWLLDQRIAVVIDETLFIHGGLSPVLLEVPPDRLNERAQSELRDFASRRERLERAGVIAPETPFAEAHALLSELVADRGAPRGAFEPSRRLAIRADAARLLALHETALAIRSDGPLWYRGTSLGAPETETPLVTAVLEHLGATRVIVGHTPSHTGRVDVRFDGRVIRADTGMLASHYRGTPAAIVIDKGQLSAFYAGEGLTPIATRPEDALARAPADDRSWEDFLATAPVVATEQIGAGSTRPLRVSLARNGQKHRAIFKPIDDAATSAGDDPRHEVAAYRLDRLLGLEMVPPTVLRTIDGRRGSLQLWVENAINEDARRNEDLVPPDRGLFERRMARMHLFDALIRMGARSETNVLITPADWRVHLIDHAGAFAADPSLDLPDGVVLEGDLKERLRALERDAVSSQLGDMLDPARLEALLARLREAGAFGRVDAATAPVVTP